jgi:hypothetical protein
MLGVFCRFAIDGFRVYGKSFAIHGDAVGGLGDDADRVLTLAGMDNFLAVKHRRLRYLALVIDHRQRQTVGLTQFDLAN